MREQITKRPAIRQQPRPKVGANAWKVDFFWPENQTARINCFFFNYNYKEQTKKTLTEKWQLTIDNICNEKRTQYKKQVRHNALCCYPNVNGAIRNLSLNTPTATIFLQFNYFRENIWVRIWVQFHFLYIFVGRVERIYKTSHITMLSFYFFPSDLQSFGDELNRSSKMALQIFELMKIESKYLDISNCVFTMNCSTEKKIVFWSFLGRDLICMWEKFQRCQSSNSSFLTKYPIFWTTNVQLLFF